MAPVEPKIVDEKGASRAAPLEAAASRPDATWEDRFALAKHLHLCGVDGDADAARRARTLLERLHGEAPNNPRVLAYRGSSLLLAAKRTLLFWEKGDLAEAGLRDLDRAVELAACDFEVRFLRAVSSRELPSFFGRKALAEADFLWLAERAEESVRAGAVDPLLGAAAVYYAGLVLEERGDAAGAQREFSKVKALAPDSTYAANVSAYPVDAPAGSPP